MYGIRSFGGFLFVSACCLQFFDQTILTITLLLLLSPLSLLLPLLLLLPLFLLLSDLGASFLILPT